MGSTKDDSIIDQAGVTEEHVHADGTVHSHEHVHADGTVHSHTHGHAHVHTKTKEVKNRLARAAGHLEKVRQMYDDGEDCAAVLMQLAAVKAALNNTAKIILQDHIEHCIVDAAESGDMEVINDLNKAIQRFME